MTTSSLIQESTTLVGTATSLLKDLGRKSVDTAVFLFTGAGSPLRARRIVRRIEELLNHLRDLTAQRQKLDQHATKDGVTEMEFALLQEVEANLALVRVSVRLRAEGLALHGLGSIYAIRLVKQARAKADLKLTPRADLFCADEPINALLTDMYDAQLQAAVATLDAWQPILEALEKR